MQAHFNSKCLNLYQFGGLRAYTIVGLENSRPRSSVAGFDRLESLSGPKINDRLACCGADHAKKHLELFGFPLKASPQHTPGPWGKSLQKMVLADGQQLHSFHLQPV